MSHIYKYYTVKVYRFSYIDFNLYIIHGIYTLNLSIYMIYIVVLYKYSHLHQMHLTPM